MASRVGTLENSGECRRKRPFRKGHLTRHESFIEEQSGLSLEERNRLLILRARDSCKSHKEEFEHIQTKLLEYMTIEKATEGEMAIEYKELNEQLERFEVAIGQLISMESMSELFESFHEKAEQSDQILEDLKDADLSTMSSQEEMAVVRTNLSGMNQAHSKIPKGLRVNLKKYFTSLKPRLKALEAAAVPATPIKVVPTSVPMDSTSHTRTRLPTIDFPKFYGDKLQWPLFWEGFTTLLKKDDRLQESDKISYLKMSVKTAAAEEAIADLTGEPGDFDNVTKALEKLYLDPHLIYKTQLRDVCDGKMVDRAGAHQWVKALLKLEKTIEKSGQNSTQFMLTVLGELKLTGKLKDDWLDGAGDKKEVPEFKDLVALLEKAARRHTLGNEDKPRSAPVAQPTPKAKKAVMFTPATTTTPPPEPSPRAESWTKYRQVKPCKLCNIDRHAMYNCAEFKVLSVAQRKDVVQRLGLCSNCLGYNHQPANCRSTRTCHECGQGHNSLLHEAGTGTRNVTNPPTSTAPTTTTTPRAVYVATSEGEGGILPTAVVAVQATGVQLNARTILDQCSELTFITRRLAKQLKATIHHGKSQAGTVGGMDGLSSEEYIDLTVTQGNYHKNPTITVKAYLTDKVSMMLPHVDLSHIKRLPFIQGIVLADPDFHLPGRIDLMLGLKATGTMIKRCLATSDDERYCIYDTKFGNIVVGMKEDSTEAPQTAAVYCSIDKNIKMPFRFWFVEDFQQHSPTLTRDEEQAVDHFQKTVMRDPEGRYVVQLPRKVPTPALGFSKMRAERRFTQNERALKKKGQWEEFKAVVDEYGELHHAERVPSQELSRPEQDCFYLPMHGVVKESSTTTKLRVVFDASAKTSNGISLNDILHPGPNQYPLLTTILTKFRNYKYGMTADISKMFREVGLHTHDRDLHRFLWRDDDQDLQVWRMTRVTFGVTSSPFLATQTLLQLAQNYETEFPLAAEVIKSNFYVDDCLTGADTLDEAVTLRTELNALLAKGKMTLRKWRTNSMDLKSTIPEEICESEPNHDVFAPELSQKTLGVHWDSTTDQMYVSAPEITTDTKATKRQVTSDLARTYDVMGWFAPAMVKAKSLIQALWMMKLDWDDDVPEDIATTWKQWTSELYDLTQHPIPRCYYDKLRKKVSVQLHGFSDASKVAYGGVIYLRTFYDDTTTTVSIVTAKTRVAPTKTQTIPRLELCGAVVTSKLLVEVQKILEIDPTQVYAWTDSMIVLGWLGQNPGRLVVFVANRVETITENVPPDQWRHVPTESNPADAASRGLMPRELIAHDLWWNGPDWLYLDPSHWPQGPRKKTIELPGIRKAAVLMTHVKTTLNPLLEKYSSLNKLVRIIAWLLRFTENCHKKTRTATGLRLTTDELVRAELLLVRGVQQEYFSTEIDSLKHKQEIRTSSSIRNLYPLLDDFRILRVGGRLENSDLSYTAKHPAILPRQSTLTKLILRRLHLDNNHVGSSTMLGLLSNEYHVIGARAAIRDLTRNCVVCRKIHTKNAHQLMGQLPAYRTRLSEPFSHTGVDFAGPITLKSGNPRKPRLTKGYICIFVCMATKAVHIEVVSDLTTDAFLASLDRFCGRRGLPQVIYSDNGTNFVGAGRELAEAYQLLQDKDSADTIHKKLTDSRVQWKHTPSRAPHFGGLWESNIKQVKILLRKSVGGVTLTYDELETILIKVESILNSRPLVPLDAQPTDGDLAITPGHFLIGKPLRAFPHLQKYRSGNLVRRWNLCKQLIKQFGDQWSKEYLRSLNRLNKWVRPQRNIQIGDVVLVKDLGPFCNVWPLGLVTEVHPGQDGKVRAATVRMKSGEFQRPIVKLTLLLPEKEQTPTRPPEDGHA